MTPKRCTATAKTTGQPCGNWAIPGAPTCRFHGSANARSRQAAARRLAEAEAARQVATLGLPIDITPTDALLEEVRWTAGHVAWLRGKVAELDPEPGRVTDDGHNPGTALTWGTTKVKIGGDDAGITAEAKPSIWYELYARERDHLVKVAGAALKAGVEERRVRLAEQQGDLVALAITRILDALNLTPDQQALVPEVVPAQLRLIAGGAS